jgi:hypothetical protein
LEGIATFFKTSLAPIIPLLRLLRTSPLNRGAGFGHPYRIARVAPDWGPTILLDLVSKTDWWKNRMLAIWDEK